MCAQRNPSHILVEGDLDVPGHDADAESSWHSLDSAEQEEAGGFLPLSFERHCEDHAARLRSGKGRVGLVGQGRAD